MNKKDFYSLLKYVPKAELHLHGEAVISKESLKELYKKNTGLTLSDANIRQIFSYADLVGFLDAFIMVQSCINSEEDFSYLMKDFYTYLEDNNIVYCETFFSPTSHIRKGLDFHSITKEINASIKKAKTCGREVKVIIDVSRSFGVENAKANLDYVLNEKKLDIIGIGLGGDEKRGKAKDFKTVFDKAKKNGLHCVSHAGEICPSSSIKDSLTYLHSERIGHGTSLIKDKKLLAEFVKKQIPLEICPTSNVFIGTYVHDIKEHPIREMYDKGIMVTLNTDDPTFFKVSLLDEYWNLYSKLNFNLKEIHEIILNGFKASFLPETKKKSYIKKVNKAWDMWFLEHPDIKEKH